MTSGINEMGEAAVNQILEQVRKYPPSGFSSEDDPYGEHDFGLIEYERTKLFWKIEYYDPTMECHSEDPSNPDLTRRVLIIMRAEEY